MGWNTLEVQDIKVIRFITEDRYKWLRHIVLLLFIWTIVFYSKDVTEYHGTFKYLRVLFLYVSLVLMLYVNINVLVPIFFFKGRYVIYFSLLILLVILSLSVMSKIDDIFFFNKRALYPPQGLVRSGYYEAIIICLLMILVTTMIKLFQRWMKDNQQIMELNNINFNLELTALKNQINPHFLFNMLNGIKSLVRSDPDKAAIVIVKLSEFLSYQLYENNDKHTPLKSEINFLSNFLELETTRRDNLSVTISCDTDSSIIKNVFLPPNLFTTFVENAVKHSVNISGEESFVHVNFNVKDNQLYFSCDNSKDPNYLPSASKKSSGLGLENIKRRLELLYGDHHILEINSTKTKYEIKLTIPV